MHRLPRRHISWIRRHSENMQAVSARFLLCSFFIFLSDLHSWSLLILRGILVYNLPIWYLLTRQCFKVLAMRHRFVLSARFLAVRLVRLLTAASRIWELQCFGAFIVDCIGIRGSPKLSRRRFRFLYAAL